MPVIQFHSVNEWNINQRRFFLERITELILNLRRPESVQVEFLWSHCHTLERDNSSLSTGFKPSAYLSITVERGREDSLPALVEALKPLGYKAVTFVAESVYDPSQVSSFDYQEATDAAAEGGGLG